MSAALQSAVSAIDVELTRLRGEIVRLSEARAAIVTLLPQDRVSPPTTDVDAPKRGRGVTPDGAARRERILAYLKDNHPKTVNEIVAANGHDPKIGATVALLFHSAALTRRKAGGAVAYSLREQDPHGTWFQSGSAQQARLAFLATLPTGAP